MFTEDGDIVLLYLMLLTDSYLFFYWHQCIGNPSFVNGQYILLFHTLVMITMVPRFPYCGTMHSSVQKKIKQCGHYFFDP